MSLTIFFIIGFVMGWSMHRSHIFAINFFSQFFREDKGGAIGFTTESNEREEDVV